MEPGVAAAAYGVETAAEGAIGASVAIAKPTMPLKASWRRVPSDTLLPLDNHVHVFTFPQSEHDLVDYLSITPTSTEGSEIPSPRVGHTAAAVDDRIYVFGGRGGKSMQPLEENGRLWVFDTRLSQWSFLDPAKGSSFPIARSYHSSTSTVHPLSEPSDQTKNPVGAASSGFDDHGTIFLHGGCSATGRLADVWGFDIASRVWSQYANAPGAPRGGPCLTFTQDRLYRFGGFDGKQELGGSMDFLHFTVSTFDDKGGKGELAVAPRTGKWESIASPEGTMSPGNRSVAGLQAVTTGQGRNYLLLFLGERDPSSSGHDKAGHFWEDVWSFQLKPEGMTAASFKDAARLLVGAKSAEGSWARVDIAETSKSESKINRPGPRGWFASSQGHDLGPGSVFLQGGVLDDNSRAGDGWMLTVDP